MQQADFEKLFRIMSPLPVTIRLLDPPLHEFLPSVGEIGISIDEARRDEDWESCVLLEAVKQRVRLLAESNPMMGHRWMPPEPDVSRDSGYAGSSYPTGRCHGNRGRIYRGAGDYGSSSRVGRRDGGVGSSDPRDGDEGVLRFRDGAIQDWHDD